MIEDIDNCFFWGAFLFFKQNVCFGSENCELEWLENFKDFCSLRFRNTDYGSHFHSEPAAGKRKGVQVTTYASFSSTTKKYLTP